MASDRQARRDAAERRSTLIGLGSAVIIILAGYSISLLPVQPSRMTTAQVVSTRPYLSRYYGNRIEVTVRNEHGFGQFLIGSGADGCKPGDSVPVVQTGIRLSPTDRTCMRQQD